MPLVTGRVAWICWWDVFFGLVGINPAGVGSSLWVCHPGVGNAGLLVQKTRSAVGRLGVFALERNSLTGVSEALGDGITRAESFRG
jgi:hypothetical protein